MIERIIESYPDSVTIFVGAYGSGKSEVSVNFALKLAELGPVFLADLDMINPFYRSADTAKLLEKRKVQLISSIFAGTNVDVPAMPAQVNKVFTDQAARSVFDIGGEDLGARVLGSLKPQLIRKGYNLFMVVNTFRPFTDTAEKIAATAESLSRASGLKISALVHNPNLLEYSQPDLIEQSWPVISKAAGLCDLPVAFASMLSDFSKDSKQDEITIENSGKTAGTSRLPLLLMERTIHYPVDNV